ncbi:hypothetical protein BH20VER1_BH20VER1_08790 [soil metagenome]
MVFRFLGVLLVVIGLAWVLATYRGASLPGGFGADNERRLARTAYVGHRAGETIERATRGLEWAPLDWQLYFLRALGKIGAKRPAQAAIDDFRRARFLEPNSFEVPYQEGTAWLRTNATLAMTAWREALRRAGPQRPELYDRMLSAAQSQNPAVRQMLEEFGSVEPELALMFMGRSQREDFDSVLAKLLRHDPTLQTLTDEQKTRLFLLWMERGDGAWLAAYAKMHAELLHFAWRGVAEHRAGAGDYGGALELVSQFAKPPTVPQVASGSSIEELQRKFLLR